MNRSSWLLRDAALGYASRGIPVLPLHYPLPHQPGLQPVGGDRPLPNFAPATGCSCRDPGCGQPAKHPLGSLVPHGVHEATTNRARVLAWWTQHPQANIGLAMRPRFDVLDVDGPAGTQAIRTFASRARPARARGRWSEPAGVAGTIYLAPTGSGNRAGVLERVDWRGRGGYVVAPPSRHHSGHPYQFLPGRDLRHPAGRGASSIAAATAASAGRATRPGRLHPGGRRTRTSLWAGGTRPRSWPGSPPLPGASATSELWEVDPQPLQPGRHRRPRRPPGPPGAAPGRRTLRAARRRAPPDPPHHGLRPPNRPGPPSPGTRPHPPRPHPCLATPASPTGGERTQEGR